MIPLIIGSLVYKRAWILNHWFSKIEQQDFELDKVGFCFVCGPGDEETIQCLIDFSANHPELQCFDIQINDRVEHKTHLEGTRLWSTDRYHTMVTLRNSLINRVSCLRPARYFSLDTDIFLEDHTTLTQLVELSGQYDIVSPLAFMTPQGIDFPSVMSWLSVSGGMAYRPEYPLGTFFKADIVMASLIMMPHVYNNVRYQWHRQGEDLGFAANAAKKGFDLYSASNLYAPHIMSQTMLKQYLVEGDNRSQGVPNL